MNALHSIPAPAIHAQAHAGLLNSPDLVTWLAYALVLTLAAFCMPTGLRESAKALWAPVGRAVAALCCPWLWEGCFLWSALSGAFLAPLRVCEKIFQMWREGIEQLVRLAFCGYPEQIVT
jgi:hypothetical protein